MSANDAEARRALLVELRTRHVAYAVEQLTGDGARALLRSNLAAGIATLLDARVADVVTSDAIVRAIDAFLGSPSLEKGIRPLVKTFALLEAARMREDTTKLSEAVPDKARADIRELLERPSSLAPKLVRQIAEHEAAEAVMREVLDHAIHEFQTKVNPFTSEWGLPSLLKRMGPLGLGLAKTLDGMQAEFDKHVEPELKRFLHGAAKRGLKTGAAFVVERSEEPAFVALRREIFAWLLEQPVNEVLGGDERHTELVESATFEIARHVVRSEASRRRRRATIEMMYGAHKNQSIREALATYGIEVHVDVDALTGVLFQPLVTWVKSGAGARFIDELVGSFYARELASLPVA